MARPLRIEYPGAIHHVMSRGNLRRSVFEDERDYQRLLEGLEQTVRRFGWDLLSFVLMPNHFHLFLRTPEPNLSRGMQYLVSGYANWYAKRHRRPGHLTQGRFKATLVEDESYFWTVSRYVHLNPVWGKRPLAAHPAEWPWSSYAGYARRRDCVGWVAYEAIYAARQGEMGGSQTEASYRRFVEAGLAIMPEDPCREAAGGWLLGSPKFVKRLRRDDHAEVSRRGPRRASPGVLRLPGGPRDRGRALWDRRRSLLAAAQRRSEPGSGCLAARELTPVTLRELSAAFGLTHPDSVRNLIRRVDRALLGSRPLRDEIEAIRQRLLKTEPSREGVPGGLLRASGFPFPL